MEESLLVEADSQITHTVNAISRPSYFSPLVYWKKAIQLALGCDGVAEVAGSGCEAKASSVNGFT